MIILPVGQPMIETIDIRKKYEEKIKKISEELAEDLLKNEPNLIVRFRSFDAEVHKVLMEVGKQTMMTIGISVEEEIKKKLLKVD